MVELKRITYTIDADDPAPIKGQYLVTIGRKRGILSVMLIKEVRKIRHKTIGPDQAYELQMYNCPDLKPFTDFERNDYGADVWVRGEPALPCFWHPRGVK